MAWAITSRRRRWVHMTPSRCSERTKEWNAASPATIAAGEDSRPDGGPVQEVGNRPQARDRLMSSIASAVGVGLLGVLAGVPARAVIQRLAGPPAAAQAGRRWQVLRRPLGLLWFALTCDSSARAWAGRSRPTWPWRSCAWCWRRSTPPPGCCPTASPTRRSRWWPGCCWSPASAWTSLAGSVAACSRRPRSAGLFLLLALLSPHGVGWAMSSCPDLGPGARLAVVGDGGGGGVRRLPARRPGGAGRHAGTWPVAHVAAAVRTLAGRRCAAGRPSRRRGRRLVPGRLARRQIGRVSSYRR
jgi:hypothetical protein